MKNTLLHLEPADTVTGLPTRRAFAANLQRWLISQPDGTLYVAANISLPTIRSRSGSKGIDGTLQDLLAYRASVLLTQHTRQNTLLGRADRQSLLLVQPCTRKTAARSRAFVRGLLGDLGGLIDDPDSIVIRSLISSVRVLSANEVLRRLQPNPCTRILDVVNNSSSAELLTT
ncbi:MAG: hypothetical protein AB8B97_16030 [Granulosicoccus sp.]